MCPGFSKNWANWPTTDAMLGHVPTANQFRAPTSSQKGMSFISGFPSALTGQSSVVSHMSELMGTLTIFASSILK